MKFAQQHRFTPEQEAEICSLYATGQHSQHALARQFGCSQGTIARILKDKPEMNVAALQRRVAELEAKLVAAKREGMKEAARIIQKVWDTSTQDDPDEWIDAYPDPASYPAVTTYIAAINDALAGGKDGHK